MLDKERFLAMKKLAKDIRKDNEKTFESFEKESVEDAIREKEEFIESMIDVLDVKFTPGEEGKEEKQIFRANLLIPDDVDFFQSYSNDKNIRNLMNKYAVGIEDIMSKITELNLYSEYIDTFDDEKEDDYIQEEITPNDAESLLREIEDLSSAMDELNITDENDLTLDTMPTFDAEEEKQIEIKPEEIKEDIVTDNSDDDFEKETEDDQTPDIEIEEIEPTEVKEMAEETENIITAVSDFVDEYGKLKRELEFTQAKIDKFNSEKEDIRTELNKVKAEKEELERKNDGLNLEIYRSRENIEKLETENKALKTQMESMEKTFKQSTDLLKEIYKSIPKKED